MFRAGNVPCVCSTCPRWHHLSIKKLSVIIVSVIILGIFLSSFWLPPLEYQNHHQALMQSDEHIIRKVIELRRKRQPCMKLYQLVI